MASNFDKTFEKNKTSFKQKFNANWNESPQLYLTYLQTLYVSSLTEIANNGLGQVISKQEDFHSILQSISQKIK